jgi:hypothetical protein
MTDLAPPHPEHIRQAAQWLADRQPGAAADTRLTPFLPTVKARFGLTDADAAEAILLAGNFSICRRAFG